MLKDILLPQLGQTMEEGTVERWHKAEGDRIEKGDVLYELTTDKATLEVEAFVEGVLLKILAGEGQTVPVNDLVAIVGEEGDELPEDLEAYRARVTGAAGPGTATAEEQEAEEAPATEAAPAAPVAAAPPVPGRVPASPRARKIAQEQKVPLAALAGSGPNGRIIERDVRGYIEKLSATRHTPAAREAALAAGVSMVDVQPSKPGGRITREDVARAVAAAPTTPTAAGPGERIALSPMRRTIALRMSEAKRTVPHFYLGGEVLMRNVQERREELNAAGGPKITLTHMLVRAAALALKAHPGVNARFEGDTIVVNQAVNVGVAVAVEDGLFVPVLKNADARTLAQIATELGELARLAREGRLRPDQYEGGSITISNLGMYGVAFFLPIINSPESCILGVGGVSEQVVAQGGAMRIEPVMQVTLSADHRVIDGAQAAEFYATFRELLEEPEEL